MIATLRRNPRSGDRDEVWPMQLRRRRGNLLLNEDGGEVWMRLPYVPIAFRPGGEVDARVSEFERAIAALAGHRIKIRTAWRPYPTEAWARRLHARSNPPDKQDWRNRLVELQHHLHQAGGIDVKYCYLGVKLTDTGMLDRFRRETGQEKLAKEAAAISGLLSDMAGAIVPDIPEMDWLLRRSVTIGLATPPLPSATVPELDTLDLPSLLDHVYITPVKGDRCVRITYVDLRGTERHTYVAIATLGPVEQQDLAALPWLHYAELLPFPVEVSAIVNVLDPEAAGKAMKVPLRKAAAQIKHYAEHGRDEDILEGERFDLARSLEAAVRRGGLEAVLCDGWFRFAVWGETAEMASDRMSALVNHYRRREMDLFQPENQHLVIREFFPGEPLYSTNYKRHFPPLWLAAGMPQAASALGDDTGPYIGYQAGTSHRPVLWDPHYASQVTDQSALTFLLGSPGAGKTTLAGDQFWWAVQRGIRCAALDPGGMLHKVAQLPEMRDHVRILDLARDAEAGSMNPYQLVLDPPRPTAPPPGRPNAEYTAYQRALAGWQERCQLAAGERQTLAAETLWGVVPPELRNGDTRVLIGEAVGEVGGDPGRTLWDVVDWLGHYAHSHRDDRDDEKWARRLHTLYSSTLRMGKARLFAPPRDEHGHVRLRKSLHQDALATIVSMPGLDTTADLATATADQLVNMVLLMLAATFTSSMIYEGDPHRPKLLFLDEVHVFGQFAAGRALLSRLGRENRRYDAAVLVSTQNPADAAMFGGDFANFSPTCFIGRIKQAEVAARALELAGAPVGEGWEQAVMGLRPGEFLFRDASGLADLITVDLSWHPALKDALNTTPGHKLNEEDAA